MKKNELLALEITDIGVNGEGIGKSDGFPFFVKNAVIGDRVKAVITKMNKHYGFAKTLEILEQSPWRTEPVCPKASQCGGCQIMHLAYPQQLAFKERKVRNHLERIGGICNPVIRPILGMQEEIPLHFRNKMQFPVGLSKEGRVITGFYAGRTHYIIETDRCPVSAPETDSLMECVRKFLEEYKISVYDEKNGQGLVRHVLIRTGTVTGQIMVCLVINGSGLRAGARGRHGDIRPEEAFVKALRSLPEIGSRIRCICLNENRENTNVILGRRMIPLYGELFIEDVIGEIVFRISPLSFFQVNGIQTEKLYQKTLDYAGLTGQETVWDLYCGTGTISLFLAKQAGHVYGVEIVPEAIKDAKENAKRNGITNAEFFCGRSEEIFPAYYEDHTSAPPDVVVLDPPRKGCDRILLDAILRVEPAKIVYVSCDSATLARDLKILSEKYRLEEATPVDMFPHTMHVETVCLLSNRKPDARVKIDVDLEDYYRIKDEQKKNKASE